MKRWYDMRRVGYLARNNCHLQFVAMTMERALVLIREA
jgi:hypothetical protein